MKADLNDTQAMPEPEPHITPYQAHTLIELGGIMSNILEFDQCGQIISRLRTLAYELEQLYGGAEGIQPLRIARSTRPEIRALNPADALDFLELQSFD